MSYRSWLAISCLTLGCGGEANHLGDLPESPALRMLGAVVPNQDDCTASPDGPFVTTGVLDALLTNRYQALLAVQNPGEQDVLLRMAAVSLTDTQGNVLREFTADVGGMVPAGGSSVTAATLVPSSSGLPPHLRADVVLHGETTAGAVESLSLRFLVQICSGCLIAYPTDADDTSQPGYQCARAPEQTISPPCLFGQDDLVDCRYCAGTIPECFAP